MKENSLFRWGEVLWKPFLNRHNEYSLENTPYCPNDGCRSLLGIWATTPAWYCHSCQKDFPFQKNQGADHSLAKMKFEGFKIQDWEVYSLDLPPTKIGARDSDENYWIEARITEKGGRKLGVVYFGENLKEQGKKDYSQVFVELEKEEVRFDKSNKNPNILLCKLEAHFKKSKITQDIHK